MDTETIKEKLEQALALDECIVKGENGTFQVIAVSAAFADMSRVKKQQAIHALSIKALTPDEWQKQKHFI
jgi:acid stress-induced BolA-like protein IbaG/YrbA